MHRGTLLSAPSHQFFKWSAPAARFSSHTPLNRSTASSSQKGIFPIGFRGIIVHPTPKNLRCRAVIFGRGAGWCHPTSLDTCTTASSSSAHTLLYGANIEMIHIDAVRESNAQAREYVKELVCVFVGGTGKRNRRHDATKGPLTSR